MCDDYTVVSDEKWTCVAPKCGENEKVIQDGSCEECDKFTVVSRDMKTCLAPSCVGREFITKDGTCLECPPYMLVADDKMSCVGVTCPDENSSVNADGECHDYDETLEGELEDLKYKSLEMGQILIKMDEKMNEMLDELQKERAEKEDWQRMFEDENALALEYKLERNTY